MYLFYIELSYRVIFLCSFPFYVYVYEMCMCMRMCARMYVCVSVGTRVPMRRSKDNLSTLRDGTDDCSLL